eukprot:TRINITY_DN3976_c0_g4_i4.p1 TRINITY_DN3976_c0_g4~~TRINITY_DN3976_c0_g4_i4.p1  ORF type:complete len:282 (-),score=62.33 TRINITY_DN3976_c0_g4_i4:176-1021(-)
MSLIIPCFTEHPVGSSMMTQLTDNEWLDTYVHPRFFGLLDLDFSLDAIKKGIKPIFENVEGIDARPYTSREASKLQFAHYVRSLGGNKYSWALEHNQEFQRVFHVTRELEKIFANNNIPTVSFFTGGAGFRILFRDPRMYFLVGWWENYSETFKSLLWPAYLTHCLGCSEEMKADVLKYTDPSIYDRDKGVKPDLHDHYTTRVWPTKLQGFENLTIDSPVDTDLCTEIVSFWEWVFLNIPSELPRIPGSIPQRVLSTLERAQNEEEMMENFLAEQKKGKSA